MLRNSFWESWKKRPLPGRERARTRLAVERLEERCVPAITAVTGVPLNATEGATVTAAVVANFADNDATLTANQFNVTIDYGDGTTPVTNVQNPPAGQVFDPNLQVSGSNGSFTVTDTHTFPEESGATVPPLSFKVQTTVTENVNGGNTLSGTGEAFVQDAALSPGDPVPIGPGTPFFGGDQGNATDAATALGNFEKAIGGSKNTAPSPQNGGFRVITWDGVKLDGTDNAAGPNSTVVIDPGKTVGISLNRFQGQGVFFEAIYAVSKDEGSGSFVDVNPSVGAPNPILFPAFSTPNTFAMFNSNDIDFSFVPASSPFTTPASAASQGFGAIFLNVQQPGTTIQYFHGNTLIDTLAVPTNSTPGAAVFAGELFASPIVTNVKLNLGEGVIFNFDGTTFSAGGTNSASNNLVAVDDWVYAEPVPIQNGIPVGETQGTLNTPPIVHVTQGQTFSGTAATFTDLDPNANAKDFTATIDWGDGHSTNGSIVADGKGGFNVTGTNTYAAAGTFPIHVLVQDFGGSVASVTNAALVDPLPPPPPPPPPPAVTAINITGVTDKFVGFTQQETVTAKVTSDGQPLGGASVQFTDGGQTQTATTDSSGQASVTFNFQVSQGQTNAHTIDAVFAGTSSQATSSTSFQQQSTAGEFYLELLFELYFLHQLGLI